MTKTKNQSILLLIRGIPGSGKSYFANSLHKAIGDNNCILLDPDATDYGSPEYAAHVKEQLRDGVDPALHPYRYLRAQAYEGIQNNKIIIWNQPFSNLEILKKVTDRLKEFATNVSVNLSIIMVEVNIDPLVAKQRVNQRIAEGGHGPSEKTFGRFVDNYSTATQLGYETVAINGLDSPEITVPIVAKQIAELFK